MPSGGKTKIYPQDMVDKVNRMYASGMTQVEIGATIGVSQKVIYNLMRRHCIQTRIAAKRDQRGEKNSAWKGDGASYAAFHYRLRVTLGNPKKCDVCGTEDAKQYDYANLTGSYHDMNDYKPMCRSCHSRFDGKIKNITSKKRRDADAEA
jgi:hypothetical protein